MLIVVAIISNNVLCAEHIDVLPNDRKAFGYCPKWLRHLSERFVANAVKRKSHRIGATNAWICRGDGRLLEGQPISHAKPNLDIVVV